MYPRHMGKYVCSEHVHLFLLSFPTCQISNLVYDVHSCQGGSVAVVETTQCETAIPRTILYEIYGI